MNGYDSWKTRSPYEDLEDITDEDIIKEDQENED
jgi:hypothetical protein